MRLFQFFGGLPAHRLCAVLIAMVFLVIALDVSTFAREEPLWTVGWGVMGLVIFFILRTIWRDGADDDENEET